LATSALRVVPFHRGVGIVALFLDAESGDQGLLDHKTAKTVGNEDDRASSPGRTHLKVAQMSPVSDDAAQRFGAAFIEVRKRRFVIPF
jgi:hypothetical protein